MDEIALNRIRGIMNRKHVSVTALSERIDISRVTLSRYLNGQKTIPLSILDRIAQELETDLAELFSNDNLVAVKKWVNIPVLGEIACGTPILAEQNVSEYIARPQDEIPNGNVFYLLAKGNSMEPTIPDGSRVLIRHQFEIEDREIGAFLFTNTNEVTLKRPKRIGNTLLLLPDNSEYEPIVVDHNNPVTILGKALSYTKPLD